jgi:hypothetical protein
MRVLKVARGCLGGYMKVFEAWLSNDWKQIENKTTYAWMIEKLESASRLWVEKYKSTCECGL